MTQQEYDELVANSQPNGNFSLNWSSYSSKEFRDTFLPNVTRKSYRSLVVYDGAAIFNDLKAPRFDTPFNDSFFATYEDTVIYTFPSDVNLLSKHSVLSPTVAEVFLLVSRTINDQIELSFKSGDNFKKGFAQDREKSIIQQAEGKIFQLSLSEFTAFFQDSVSEKSVGNLISSLTGIDSGGFYEDFRSFLPEKLESEYLGLYSANANSSNALKCTKDIYLDEYNKFIKGFNFGAVQNLDGEMEIYRSPSQMTGKYGSNDAEYFGEFGFDRYDASVDGSGKLAQRHFPEIPEIKTDFRPCILSLWAPKTHQPTVMKNDPAFSPVVKCNLVFKTTQDPGKNAAQNNANIYYNTGTTSITINGQKTGTLKKNGTSPFYVGDTGDFDIECTGVITSHQFVVFRDTSSGGRVLAVLVVVPNNAVYSTKFKLIDVQFSSTKALAETKKTHPLASSLKDYCNNHIFNQAFIYCLVDPIVGTFKVPRTDIGNLQTDTSLRTWVDTSKMEDFHKSVVALYNDELVKNSGSSIDKDVQNINNLIKSTETGNNSALNAQKQLLRDALKNFGKLLVKKFKRVYKKDPLRIGSTFTDTEVVNAMSAYKTERLNYKTLLISTVHNIIDTDPNFQKFKPYKTPIQEAILAGKMLSKSASAPKIDVSNTIYTFLHPGIHSFRDSETSTSIVAGFTLTGNGYVHMLDVALSKPSTQKEELIGHEFGHAFNLEHTFDTDHETAEILKDYNDDIKEAKKKRDDDIAALSKSKPSSKALDDYYDRLLIQYQKIDDLAKSFKYNSELTDIDFDFNPGFIQSMITNEKNARGTIKTTAQINTEFNNRKTIIENRRDERLESSLDIVQSKTLENLLDYDVSRMQTLWYWQWIETHCGGEPLKEHIIK